MTEIVAVEEQAPLPVVPSFLLSQGFTWGALEKLTSAAVKGGFSGRHKTPEAAFCAAVFGMELGLTVNQALQNVHVIHGTAAINTKTKLALCEAAGVLQDHDCKVENGVATATVKRKGRRPVTCTFSMEDAKRAGLLTKDIWKAYPDVMKRWRAYSQALDLACPDITKGVRSTEEIDESFEQGPGEQHVTLKEATAWANESGTSTASPSVSTAEASDSTASSSTEEKAPKEKKPAKRSSAKKKPDLQVQMWSLWTNLKLDDEQVAEVKEKMGVEVIHPGMTKEELERAVSFGQELVGPF